MPCDACMPDDAAQAWAARSTLSVTDRVCQESHFGVTLRACGHCGQRFASVFSERIDWRGGNDPQSTLLIPVDHDEASALLAAGESIEATLRTLSPRRHLDAYFGAESTTHDLQWRDAAPLLMPHD